MSDLDDVARRAAERLRSRAEDIADPAAALQGVKAGEAGSERPADRWTGRWPAWVAAAMLVVAVTGAALVVLWPDDDEATIVSPTVAATTPPTTVEPPATTEPPATATTTDPTPATTIAPTTTEPGPSTTAAEIVNGCTSELGPPPVLIDGRAPGTAEVTTLEGGLDVARWGSFTPAQLTQSLGEIDRELFDFVADNGGLIERGPYQAAVVPIGDPPISEIGITILDTSTGCLRHYWIGPGFEDEEVRTYVATWLETNAANDPGSADLIIAADGNGPAPILPLTTIPWGDGPTELTELPDGWRVTAALNPLGIVVPEVDPATREFTGRGVLVDRPLPSIVEGVTLDGIEGDVPLWGVVGSADSTIFVQVVADGGQVIKAMREAGIARFEVVAETARSEGGDGRLRIATNTIDGGNITFGPPTATAGTDWAVANQRGATWDVVRTDAGGATSTWAVFVEQAGATFGYAEALLDGALFVAEDVDTQDLAFLDPDGERTVSWRLADGWQLVDHDGAGALLARATVAGAELAWLDTRSLVAAEPTPPQS